MRRWQPIQAARDGIHETAFGVRVEVSHTMQRTYAVPPKEDTTPKWEPESGRGDGWYIKRISTLEGDFNQPFYEQRPFLKTWQRQLIADAQHSPRKEEDES